jgi:CheY-like chemotaxis protein
MMVLVPTSNSDSLVQQLHLDADRCLLKPISASELIRLANRFLGRLESKRLNRESEISTARALHVLVVDDSDVNREIASGFLELFGHTCDCVENGVEAVAAAQANAYDAVLMDVEMPILDGLEATRRIRAFENDSQHLPILAMTAHALAGIENRCLEAGMDGCLTKPIQPEQLFETLESITHRMAESEVRV